MSKLQDIFTKEYLMQLESLAFTFRNKLGVTGYSGARRSAAKGSSLEFSDFREYIPGDDLRRVDWKGYGRFGKLNTKLFFEEKQAEVSIFLDCSQSMAGDEKFTQAKALTASYAYIALCGGERVNVFGWNEKVVWEKRGIVQKTAFLEVLRLLEQAQAEGTTNPLRAAVLSGRIGRGVSIVISDFLSDNSPFDAVRVLQEKKQEVFLIQLLAKEEAAPSPGGTVRFIDAETKESQDIEVSALALAAYDSALKEYRGSLADFCHARGAKFFFTTDDMPLLQAVKESI